MEVPVSVVVIVPPEFVTYPLVTALVGRQPFLLVNLAGDFSAHGADAFLHR